MMRRTVGVLAGAVLLAGAIQSPALAQQIQRTRLSGLELTEEQKAQMEQLREKHQEEAAKVREELVKAQAELTIVRAKTDLDLKELEQAMNHLSQLQNAEIIRGIENNKEMMGLLTEEQLKSLDQVRRFAMGRVTGNRMRGSRGQAFGGRGRTSMRGQAFGGRGGRAMSGRGRTYQRGNAGLRGSGRPGMQRGRATVPPTGRSGFRRAAIPPTGLGVQPGNAMRQFQGRGIPPLPPPPPPPTE